MTDLRRMAVVVAVIGSVSAIAAPSVCEHVETFGRFELIVLGSGGPGASGRAASGYLVAIDRTPRVLIDAGPGTFARLGELGVDLAPIDTVLLTHLHIDHAGELPGFVKARDVGVNQPLTFHIFGPAGRGVYPATTTFVDRLFGKQGAFAYLAGFRNPLGLTPVDLPIAASAPVHPIADQTGLKISSIAVDHDEAPAVAFRIEHAGHAVVISGDLASKNDNLITLAKGADLLVYDTSVLDPPGSPAPLYDLHTPPKRIGEVASKAKVKSLLLSHLPPAIEQAQPAVLQSVKATFAGPVRFANDCLRIPLDP